MYSLIIFLLLVLPVAIKNYLSNSEFNLFIRLLNIIVSLLIFSIFFEEFRFLIWDFYERGTILSIDELSRCPSVSFYCSFIKALYISACLYIAASSLGLGRGNNKSRVRFLKHLKYIWIILGLYFANWSYILDPQQETNIVAVSLVMLLVSGMMMLVVYLFYSSKYISRLYNSDNVKHTVDKVLDSDFNE